MFVFLMISGFVLIGTIGVLLTYAATRPDTFRIARAVIINAPAKDIFALIVDMRKWSLWSPYETKDSDMARTFSGSSSGVGSVYEYSGNKNIGTGRLEILEAVPYSKIRIKLHFVEPFQAHNTAEFTLVPQDGSTELTWSMSGPSPYLARLMGLFFNMDKMVGDDFALGLANIKAISEDR